MDLNEYRFEGRMGEKIPKNVQRLIVNPGIQVLPSNSCCNCQLLQEVALPQGLVSIGSWAFGLCKGLSEIKICSTIGYIGCASFRECLLLTKVDFEFSSSSPHQLKAIDQSAFIYCTSLQRIKVPSSVNKIGRSSFEGCNVLVEARLSTTTIRQVPSRGFRNCASLQTVTLPNSLERICEQAFFDCPCLIAVTVPLNYQSIKIGRNSFAYCRALSNITFPHGSAAHETSFRECAQLHDRFGEEGESIVAGLIARFDNLPVHRLCYDRSSVSTQELCQCIQRETDEKSPLVDEFGMTPFHILFSSAEPCQDLLEVLLENYQYHILDYMDANGKRPLEYLVSNWTETAASLLRKTLQRWMVDPLVHRGATFWAEAMQRKLEGVLAENGALCNEPYSLFVHYEAMETMSILELALWKGQLQRGCCNDGHTLQAPDREESRCICGSNVAIPSVGMFLGIPGA